MIKYRLLVFLLFLVPVFSYGQGVLSGNVTDEKKKPLEGVTVELIPFVQQDKKTTQTDKEGEFGLNDIPYGYYKLKLSYVGLQSLDIDSINFRKERADFNLPDLVLKAKTNDTLGEVIVYAEKPLIQSKEGNITFNASESALAAGSNASDLLTNVPLVSKDPGGKITVRGKEPKILIDDKPVVLNMQQLQDLLESMPGSSIEKIEVMTNPPPQYANEQGGVINIVTRKGKVGKSGRINISAGTRGETAISGNYTYRKQGFALHLMGGLGYSRLEGEGYSTRNNIYTDSSNYFNTTNNYLNKGWRPNFRVNMDYDFNKYSSLNFVVQYNQSKYDNVSTTEYKNINRFDEIYRLSQRTITSSGNSYTPSASLSFLHRGKKPGESFKIITSSSISPAKSDRDFYQQYFNPDYTPKGIDSTQKQLNDNRNSAHNVTVDYNHPLNEKKTFMSVGGYYNRSNSSVNTDASYLKKPEGEMVYSPQLSREFDFHQTIVNFRASIRQVIKENFSVTVGSSAEQTAIWFELYDQNRDVKNNYWTWLPFANINRNWKDKLNLTLAYRRSISRPGINHLNPTIDFGDPYNIRFGNENLVAATAHNFDFILGRTKTTYFVNLGLGYNIVEDVFGQVRTLLADGKTQITWENISGRKEYEVSAWGGLTISKKLRSNMSASYNYNEYSSFDKTVNRYRNGGSFTSNASAVYTPNDRMSFTGSFNFNRFANPQGYARWNWSMNLGIQRRFFQKRLSVTLNVIDPFSQKNTNYTYGSNFVLYSYNNARTKNFRINLGYNFTKTPKKKPSIVLPKTNK